MHRATASPITKCERGEEMTHPPFAEERTIVHTLRSGHVEVEKAAQEAVAAIGTLRSLALGQAEPKNEPGRFDENKKAALRDIAALLFELSGECTVEGSPDHCNYCRAFFAWKELLDAYPELINR